MKIIPPHKVTAQLLDIIHEAERELVLVSPYVDFTSWQKPVNAIKRAMARNIKVTFYIRSNQESQASYDHVRRLGLHPVLVENLHAKMYLSEKDGLLTSMNLLRYSDSNSIEIGAQVEQPAELEELHRIVHRFIAQQPSVAHATAPPVAQPIPSPVPRRFDESLEQHLREQVDRQAGVKWTENSALRIAALGNSFTFALGHPANKAELYGIVSEREADRFQQKRQKHFTDEKMIYSLLRKQGHYTTIRGVHTLLLADRDLDKVTFTERQRLHHTIANFVRAVRALKDDY
ncbi:MAG TPA: hypothetical protein VF630_05385 [Hymenobacter sp.]|jgi:phosphatidylserine/phosphatidylglycerophosphate/cardiolipin synthase-like enzyme